MKQKKFRVWDTLEKRYILPDKGYHGHYCLDLNGKFYNLQNGSGGKECIVEQWLDQTDINHIDIYEGDILQITDYICDIKCEDNFLADRFFKNIYRNKLFFDDSEVKIIGNIHENPDLSFIM